MKKLLLVSLLAIQVAGLCLAQNQTLPHKIQHLHAPLDKGQVPSGHLWDLGLCFAEPLLYRGTVNDSNFADINTFGMLYGAMRNSHIGSAAQLPAPESYMEPLRETGPDAAVPITLMAWRYDRLRPDAATLNLVQYANGQLHDVAGRSQLPYWTDTLIVGTPLVASANSLTPRFCLPASLWYSNLGTTPPVISIDTGDGHGWHTLALGDTLNAQYQSTGEKVLLFRMAYPGFVRYAHAKITINDEGTGNRSNAMSWPQGTYESIFVVSSKTYTAPDGTSAPGAATMHIFYNQSNCNSSRRMVRPLIVVEGYEEVEVASSSFPRMFQLLDNKDWSTSSNPENLTDHLYPYEYDLIYVDLFDGSDYIQRNAYVVEEVIKIVNAMKAEAGSTEPNVVIGVSMGGVAGMYALKDMNNSGPVHDTRLFFTYDSPLRGANIPIATQCLIKFMRDNLSDYTSGQVSIPELDRVWKAIQAPTPRQLLRYHVNNIGTGGVEPINTFSTAFFAEMDALGGLGCRHVALSNGAGNGTSIENGIMPDTKFFDIWGEKVICVTVSNAPLIIFCGHVEFSASLKATGNGVTNIFSAHILRDEPFSQPTSIYESISCPTKPFDTAPGGSSNLGTGPLGVLKGALEKAGVTVGGPGLTATHHSFIPTFSSISMASVPSNITGAFTCGTANRCTTAETATTCPFNNLSEINQAHVALDERIALVLIEELVTNSTPPQVNILNNYPVLNTYFNVGKAIYAPIPSITITTSNGKLSVNNTGRVAFATGDEPLSPLNKLYVDTKCDALITVEAGAQLVIGADGGIKHGELKVTSKSRVHIKTGGTLRVTSSDSRLWIKPEGVLILDPGAIVILDDPESNIFIEGALILNGNINFMGNGYFHFSNTHQLSLGPNADAFRLIGRGATQRFVKLTNTSLTIPDGKGIDLKDGLIENNSSNIFLSSASWAVLRHVNMLGFAGAGARGLEGRNVGNVTVENCYFNGIDVPFYIDGSSNYQSNKVKIVNSEFRNYPDGSYFAKRWDVFLEGCKFISGGSAGHGLFFEDNFVNLLRNCEIEGHDHIDASGIKSEGNWLVWMDGGEIRGCETGIKNIDGKPSNIIMTNWATIKDCTYGIDMIGNATNGLVLMDCARLITNVFGIHGQDITLVIAPQVIQQSGNTPRPNVFIRKSTGGWFMEVCYKLKKSPEPLSAQFNFWGVYNNGAPTITDVEPWNHIDLRKTGNAVPCAQSILVVTNPSLGVEPIGCRRDGLVNPLPIECYTLVNTGTVNGSSVTISQQFQTGLNLIQTGDYDLSKTSFVPVADLWDPELSSGSPDCNLLTQAGRSLASGQWYATEEQSENRKDNALSKTTDFVFPNPTGELFYIENRESASIIEIWDIFGQKWLETTTDKANFEVDCSAWPSGIYLVELQGPSGRQRAKVVVQH